MKRVKESLRMGLKEIVGLLGGLALFLYGMQMMSAGMEAAAGNKMKVILEKLTSNRFLGVAVGALITAVIQSSSATTVMVVGFVNSGMMTLQQAVWIIMGANIGTTITGQLIAMDMGAIAPLIAFLGVALILFTKKAKVHHVGSILAGLGILFIGMDMMSGSMMPLRESETFIRLMTQFENPLLGILAGAGFTALIQSSSASVGILQALAKSGVIGFSSAVYVLFGQNIGTCITAILASIGTNRNAKRTTIIHLSFNIIGTIIFTLVCISFPLADYVASLTPGKVPAQIANMHTLFNIATTLLLIPFGTYLAKFAQKVLPDLEEMPTGNQLMFIRNVSLGGDNQIGNSAIHVEQTRKELERMLDYARQNVHLGFQTFINGDVNQLPVIEETEEKLDFLNKEISKYITNMITHETNEKGSRIFNAFFNITGNIERIGDHAMNIGGYAKIIHEKRIHFSDAAQMEIENMQKVCDKLLDLLQNKEIDQLEELTQISALEQRIDDMTLEYRNNMLQRLKDGSCLDEGSIIYSELLTDFERIGDHALNISQQLVQIHLAQ